MQRSGLLVLLAGTALLLTGCTASREITTAPSASVGLVDPLQTVTDSKSPDFIDAHVAPVLHKAGSGPQRYSISVSAGQNSLRSYLVCAPAGSFKVSVAGKSFWGHCGRQVGATADIPVPTTRPGSEPVKVSVSKGTHFDLLLIATPED